MNLEKYLFPLFVIVPLLTSIALIKEYIEYGLIEDLFLSVTIMVVTSIFFVLSIRSFLAGKGRA